MFAKLLPDILDRLDIFILEIEELQVPKPQLWKHLWCLSIIVTFFGLSAIKKNKINVINQLICIYGIIIFGFGTTLFGAMYYFYEVWTYLRSGVNDDIILWQGLPYGLLWYVFILAAFQVHFFFIYFAWNLRNAWKTRGSHKKSGNFNISGPGGIV